MFSHIYVQKSRQHPSGVGRQRWTAPIQGQAKGLSVQRIAAGVAARKSGEQKQVGRSEIDAALSAALSKATTGSGPATARQPESTAHTRN